MKIIYINALYLIGIVLTFIYTSITIRNQNDEDRTYADPPEWDFSHIGAAIMFPLFWVMEMFIALGKILEKLSRKIYDNRHK